MRINQALNESFDKHHNIRKIKINYTTGSSLREEQNGSIRSYVLVAVYDTFSGLTFKQT